MGRIQYLMAIFLLLASLPAHSQETIQPIRVQSEEETPEEKYETGKIWFPKNEVGEIIADKEDIDITDVTPLKGIYEQDMEWEDFYQTIGNPDYLDHFHKKQSFRHGMMWGGAIVAVVGFVFGTPFLVDTGLDPCFGTFSLGGEYVCAFGLQHVIGLSILAAGATTAVIGDGSNPHPITLEQARGLANEYNQNLRKELGLEQRQSAISPPMKRNSP